MNSVKIIIKYTGHCFECAQLILKGNSALLYNGIGLKCIECIIPFIEDDSRKKEILKMNSSGLYHTCYLSRQKESESQKTENTTPSDKVGIIINGSNKWKTLMERKS